MLKTMQEPRRGSPLGHMPKPVRASKRNFVIEFFVIRWYLINFASNKIPHHHERDYFIIPYHNQHIVKEKESEGTADVRRVFEKLRSLVQHSAKR